MLDAWLKSKFYAKSKASIKLTKIRIEMVKRKRNAMLKYLKNDVADLLKTGLDVNAYSRAEGLLHELNISRCYDLLEQYCEHLSNNLGIMYKQRECPEECREAVSTMIFAAARFADVPELRGLRSVFTERYGNNLEFYVSKEFLQNLKSAPPTKEMKLQLMQDIASESGIEWNLKALEQKLYNPLMSEQDWPKSQNDERHKLHKKMEESAQKKDSKAAKFNHENAGQLTPSKDKVEHNSSFGRKVVPDDEYKLPMKRESHKTKRDSLSRKYNDSSARDIEMDSTGIEEVKQNEPEIDRSVPEEESVDKKPFSYQSIHAPYTISKASTSKNTSDTSTTSSTGEEGNCKDDAVEKAKPKPKSARRIRSRPQHHEDLDSSKAAEKGKVIFSNDKEHVDEEEKLIDRLLMHFSRKKSPNENKKPESSEVSRRRSVGNRATSLPVELEQTSPRELSKGHVRANSDLLGSNRHVHPKLPDYDDFVARLASLRQESKE